MHFRDCGKDEMPSRIKTSWEEYKIALSKFPLRQIWAAKLWFPMPVDVPCDSETSIMCYFGPYVFLRKMQSEVGNNVF